MITSSREKGFEAKQEGEGNDNIKFTKATPSTSRQWSAFRNPRIVRVSRSLGGKDRHSKVCTVRGLRDRRIRLSVPTAIQLYDLQDRLGLSQPSKVIDWLLDATKDDIDKLPPLQLPQGFGQFHQPLLLSHDQSSNSSIAPFFDANSTFNKDIGFHSLGIKVNNNSNVAEEKYWESETSLRATSNEKGKWVKTNDHQAQNLFPLASINNPIIPLNPQLYHWDAASNLSLSQFGTNHGLISTHQQENAAALLNTNPSSSTVSLPGSQFYMFPQYPPYAVATPMENNESRETNHFQWLTSSLGPHHHSRRNSGTQPDK